MDDFRSKTIYEQGMKEFYERKGRYRNPFPPGSDEFNLYERGWTQALKRQRGSFSRDAPAPARPLADKYRNMRDRSPRDSD